MDLSMIIPTAVALYIVFLGQHKYVAVFILFSYLLYHAVAWARHDLTRSWAALFKVLIASIGTLIWLGLTPPVQSMLVKIRFKNKPPKGGITVLWEPNPDVPVYADIVAVHGLAANPETAWLGTRKGRSRTGKERMDAATPSSSRGTKQTIAEASNPLWLRDFLPEALEKAGLPTRIMTFNHNSYYQAHALNKSLHEYAEDLLIELAKKRKSEEVSTLWNKIYTKHTNCTRHGADQSSL
jgi:hypothetical protein